MNYQEIKSGDKVAPECNGNERIYKLVQMHEGGDPTRKLHTVHQIVTLYGGEEVFVEAFDDKIEAIDFATNNY